MVPEMIQRNLKIPVCINMKVRFSAHQVIGRKKAVETENMIAMLVTDEDVVDFRHVDRETAKLHLRSFTAID